VSLLIHPQKTYSIKTGFKFLIIPLSLALCVGFFGFKSENHNSSGNNLFGLSPLNYNLTGYSQNHHGNTSKPVKSINLFSNQDFASLFDSTKKAKADTTKKKPAGKDDLLPAEARVDTTKKKSENKSITAADTTKKTAAGNETAVPVNVKTDTTKKITQNNITITADTTKKKAADKNAVAAADTTKKKVQDKNTAVKPAGKTDDAKKKDSAKDALTPAAAVKDTTKKDTVVISPDTRYLLHKSKYSHSVDVNQKYVSSFYDPFQNRIVRTVKLDSAGTKVIISETIAGQKLKPDVIIPIEEYLAARSDGFTREFYEKSFRNYEKKETKKDLSKFMSDFTKVEIPLPKMGILSIFGEPKIQLEVNGSVKVHAGWRNETQEGYTLSVAGNSHNEPDFSQEIQIGLNGKIGDKLSIGADWGTKRNFSYENVLKIKYTGYDDEIVQSVEAGNVSIQTSSLIGGSEALFGVKAIFQIGPLKLTALASQKRSQSEQKSVSSGASVTTFSKHVWEYSTNHYFIDASYAKDEIFYNYYGHSTAITERSIYVTEIEVWKTTTGAIQKGKERKGNAYLELPALSAGSLTYPVDNNKWRDTTTQSVAGMVVGSQRFLKLEEDVDYTVNRYTGVISFKTLINESEGVAVAYKTSGGSNYGELAANTADAPIIVLKLVKPPNLQPSFKKAWKLMLKNIYALGGKKIKKDGFKLYIKYQQEGVELQDNIGGKKLLNIFELDNVDASGNSSPDNEFDFISDRSIIVETGEVIFPHLYPFGENFPSELDSATYAYKAIYTNTQTMARLETSKDKFYLTGSYSASSSSTISIYNAVENSVKVSLDGVQLTAGSDYTVEYLGPVAEVVIKNPKALVAGANLSINYEQNDMLNLASKTMLGIRGMIDLNKGTTLGFTAMNLSQQTLSDKVTIGQEPLSNSMYGIDLTGTYNLPFLTKLVNNIIPTNEPSKLNLTGEFAYINPDPNTKKSTISGDDGKSIAYIDDFEGSRKIIPIGANYGGWKDISFPRLTIDGSDKNDSTKLPYKAKVNWYNNVNSTAAVTVEDLYGKTKMQQTSTEDQKITAMDFWYRPGDGGYYNRHPKLSDKSKLWGGIMRSLSSTANNLVEENMQYIEFWFRIEGAPAGAKLYIDLGQISEDIIPNGVLDTEDKNQNDAYDSGEDIGIDGLNDTDESNDTSLEESDPSGDNYSATDYTKINGTEGNASSIDLGRLPDSEDLNRNWSLDKLDNFFRYEMPIDTNTANNEFIKGGKAGHGWYLVRIPLNKYTPALSKGSPDLRIAETVRFFVAGADGDVHLRFAEVNLVGNQWRKLNAPNGDAAETDSTLQLETISIDDNKDYSSPAGLSQEIDRTKTDKTVYKNEQSLNLVVSKLEPGDRREIIKDYSRGLDVFNYKEMRMYVHGDELPAADGVSYITGNDSIPNAYFYFRFGADTTNYYEYRMPVEPGWKDMKILFSELTALKQSRTETGTLYRQAIIGKTGHSYGIRGNPSLTTIKFFIAGIVNNTKSKTDRKLYGNVWINELRVLDADSSPGWSYMGTAAFKLADIMTVNVSMQNKNPYFHKLSERFGNRTDEQSWTLATEFDLMKFIPLDLPGSSLKFSYTKSVSDSKPLYLFGTDVKVSEAVNQLEKQLVSTGLYTEAQIKAKLDSLNSVSNTRTVTETFSLPSIAIRGPEENWIFKDIVNGFTFGFNYTQSKGFSPSVVDNNSWQWDANARYQIDLSRKGFNLVIAKIPILGEAVKWSEDYKALKINFLPQTLSFSSTAKRSFTYSLTRDLTSTSTTTTTTTKTVIVPSIYRDFITTRSMEFIWTMTENGFWNITTKYNLDISGSNAYLLADDSSRSRSEKEIWHDVFSNGFFGRDYELSQTVEFRANPKFPSAFDLNKYLQMSLSYSSRYTWKNDFTQEELGRSALYDATFKFSSTLRWKSLASRIFGFEGSTGGPQENMPGQEGGDTRRGRGRGGERGGGEGAPPDGGGDVRGGNPPMRDEGQANQQKGNPPAKDADAKSQSGKEGQDGKANPVDSLAVKKGNAPAGAGMDTTAVKKTPPPITEKSASTILSAVWSNIRSLLKFSLIDYEKFDFQFEIENTYGGGALKGTGNGFNNFWGFIQDFGKGPSRLFMLGLSNNLGPRNGDSTTSITDNFTQKNKLDFKTTKPLWSGAELTLYWNINWGMSKSTQMRIDDNGDLIVNSISATGTIERSFLTVPPVLMFSTVFNNGMKKVNELYQEDKTNLSDAFIKGFETFPMLSKVPFLKDLMKYIPRPNWSLTWEGLEKYPIFNLAKKVSLSHMYTASYKEGWKLDDDGKIQIQQQTIDFSFSPLIGLNISFDQILGGTLTTSIKYNTKSIYTYSAGSATTNITLGLQNDLDLSASFLKSGFEIPLFGLALKNDIEFSVSFTSGHTSNILYNMEKFNEDGEPVDGTIRTKIAPRIKYNMSQKVNISIYYERTTIKPEGASRTVPITTNLAGVDVEIRIGN
jgi:cell surface protein SprA